MPVCSPNTSQARPGVAATIIVGSAFVPGLLPTSAAWLVPYIAAGVGVITLDIPGFCAADPPADPGLDAADLVAIATAAPEFERPGARARLEQLIQRYAWYVFCECSNGAPLAAPTFPSPPTGAPSFNPPAQTGGSALPCASESYSSTVAPTGGGQWDMRRGISVGGSGQPTANSAIVAIPTGATHYRAWETTSMPGHDDANTSHYWTAGPAWYTGTTFVSFGLTDEIQDYGVLQSPNHGMHSNINAIPVTATHYNLLAYSNTTPPGAWGQTVMIEWFCGTGANTGGQSCCTDSTLAALLTQILGQVNLIQRQIVPFAYITGTAHSGLTGHGTISVSGILGLLVNASVPASTSLLPGTPDVRIPIGRVNLATADGYEDRVELVTDSQIIVPYAAGLFVTVGYSLEPGVTATITELRREF